MRRCAVSLVLGFAVAAFVAGAGEARAQQSTKARVTVAVVPLAVPFATVDSAVSRAAADSTGSTTRWLTSGARLVRIERPKVASPQSAERPRVRRLRLEYTAN